MALVSCQECGKQISDKASACPGCGCPLEVAINKFDIDDYKKQSKEELWHKAYSLHYKGKKNDLPIAAGIYEYITNTYADSTEADYAKRQLEIIGSNDQLSHFGTCTDCGEVLQSDSGFCDKCGVLQLGKSESYTYLNNHSGTCEDRSGFRTSSNANSTNNEKHTKLTNDLLTSSQLNRYELMSADKIWIEALGYHNNKNDKEISKANQLYKLIIEVYPQSPEAIQSKIKLGYINDSKPTSTNNDSNKFKVNPLANIEKNVSSTLTVQGKSLANLFMLSLAYGLVSSFIILKLVMFELERTTGGSIYMSAIVMSMVNIVAFFYIKANYKEKFFRAFMTVGAGGNIGSFVAIAFF